MLNSAEEARRRAQLGAAAQRLINDQVPAALAAHSARGETVARVDLDPIPLKPAAGRLGRINDHVLCDALEESGQPMLALACKKLMALAFELSTALKSDVETDEHAVVDRVTNLHMDHLMLDYSRAAHAPLKNSNPILQGVSLKHAAYWRAEAEIRIVLKRMEHSALALIDMAASRGVMSTRVGWRDLNKAELNPEYFDRTARQLRERGFHIELIEAGTALRVSW